MKKSFSPVGSFSARALESLGGPKSNGEHDQQEQPLRAGTWQEALAHLEQAVSDGLTPDTTTRDLAKRLGCSEALIRKAIGKSRVLQEWRNREQTEPHTPAAQALNEVLLDRLAAPPDAKISEEDHQQALRDILSAATEAEAATIQAMSEVRQRDLTRTYLDREWQWGEDGTERRKDAIRHRKA